MRGGLVFPASCIAALAMAVGWGCGASEALHEGDAGPEGPDVSDSGRSDATTRPDGPELSDSGLADGTTPADVNARTDVACASAHNCRSISQASFSTVCCTDNACTLDTPGSCTDANVQLIQASSYDQSCTADRDCVWVLQGNACHPLDCRDPGAINMGSYAQYQSDLSKTRAASCVAPQGDCPQFGTCCRSGSCRMCSGGDAGAE
jgi:hypothetical protein